MVCRLKVNFRGLIGLRLILCCWNAVRLKLGQDLCHSPISSVSVHHALQRCFKFVKKVESWKRNLGEDENGMAMRDKGRDIQRNDHDKIRNREINRTQSRGAEGYKFYFIKRNFEATI